MIPVLYEDDALLAVSKPAGALTVRGRLGAREPSLLDALSRERGERLWAVHRLDRGTSGVLLFARTAPAHRALCTAFERGAVSKRYLALVRGVPDWQTIALDVPLVPARRGKSRPAAAGEKGKPALTVVRVLERFASFAWVEAEPRTGRPHQIRVHLKYAGFPLAIDPLYAGVQRLARGELGGMPAGALALDRTPLHAHVLSLAHPTTGAALRLEAPLSADLEEALALLRRGAGGRAFPGS